MTATVEKPALAASSRIGEGAIAFTTLGLIIFAASLLGIFTRPVGFLAALWPANAIFLGLIVRSRFLATIPGWLGAFCGYMAADIVTGGELGVTFWLTGANMVGVATGYFLFRLMPEDDRRLRRSLSVLYLFAVCLCASMIAAAAGGGIAQILFDRDLLVGFEFWFVTELVNNLMILPVLLTFPDPPFKAPALPVSEGDNFLLGRVAPVVALIASAVAGIVLGGPGAIAFSVPALVWCALTYSMFSTAIFTMVYCSWLLIGISAGVIEMWLPSDVLQSTTSIRLGVALVALGPLTVASVNAARNEALRRLAHTANHDGLTGALTRATFMRRAGRILCDPRQSSLPISVLMLDVDHFKQVNDRHGHAGGDRVLVEFARIVSENMRASDLFGRTGGEEFAVLLPGTTQRQAVHIAERIRETVEAAAIDTEYRLLRITVSIGIASAEKSRVELDSLLLAADSALYRAKEKGRNRVHVAGAGTPAA